MPVLSLFTGLYRDITGIGHGLGIREGGLRHGTGLVLRRIDVLSPDFLLTIFGLPPCRIRSVSVAFTDREQMVHGWCTDNSTRKAEEKPKLVGRIPTGYIVNWSSQRGYPLT